MSVGIRIDVQGLDVVQRKLAALSGMDLGELLDGIGGEIESQTRRRIGEEKTGPDGEPWPAWSDSYAKTRGPHHSLLIGEGHFLDSITHVVHDDELEVGSNAVQAALMQFGGEDIGLPQHKPRPYLGLSAENLDDIDALVVDFCEGLLR
jgi:phage virion morphogenesis protein